MVNRIQITSYFSRDTDLADIMQDWPEFVIGKEYDVDLKDELNNETVSVRLVSEKDTLPYVAIRSSGTGSLFERVVGKVIYAMSANSDNLMVDRLDR